MSYDSQDRTGKKPGRALSEYFECEQCGARVRAVLQPGLALRFPECCTLMMRMLDGFEVNKLLKRQKNEDEIPEIPDPAEPEEIE